MDTCPGESQSRSDLAVFDLTTMSVIVET
jgi:hypothetical protein